MSSRHARRIGYLRLPIIGHVITIHADAIVALLPKGRYTHAKLSTGKTITIQLYAQHVEYMLWLATRQRLVQWNPRRDIPASKAWHRLADGSTEHVAEWSDRLIPLDALQEAAAERFDAVAELLRAHDIQIVEPRLMPGWKAERQVLEEEQARWKHKHTLKPDDSGMMASEPGIQLTAAEIEWRVANGYEPSVTQQTSIGLTPGQAWYRRQLSDEALDKLRAAGIRIRFGCRKPRPPRASAS